MYKVEDDILRERYEAVILNPKLRTTNRWDQSDVFYQTRKRLDAMGYDVTPLSDNGRRKDIHSHIKDWCDKRNIKRHQIGIFAADRAVLAFKGKLYSVNFENYKALAHLGVDIILIEKEGIVDKLVPFTTDFGIALLQSGGFVTEFGVMLTQETEKQGANLAVLTDFDASGIILAHKIKGAIRFGAHLGVLDEFNAQKDEDGKPFEQLEPSKLMESYNGGDHWEYLSNISEGLKRDERSRGFYHVVSQHDTDYMNLLNTKYKFEDGSEHSYIDFIRYDRIELNTIMLEVGAQRFWNWLKDKILQIFPTRDYNRAITVPEFAYPDVLFDMAHNFELWSRYILKDNVKEKQGEFVLYEGLIDNVDQEQSNIQGQFKGIINTNTKLAPILKKIKPIVNKLEQQFWFNLLK